MGGRIIASKRNAEAEQENDEPEIAWARHEQQKEDHKNDHFHNEHDLAAEIIRQPAEADGPDQDAKQARRSDHAVLHFRNIEFFRDKRHGDTGHEDDETFEKFARRGERPDTPLHCGHWRRLEGRSICPDWSLVDISLYRSSA